MKKDLLQILACPACKTYPLSLSADEEKDGEIIRGAVTCPKCGASYPIDDAIPNMIPKK